VAGFDRPVHGLVISGSGRRLRPLGAALRVQAGERNAIPSMRLPDGTLVSVCSEGGRERSLIMLRWSVPMTNEKDGRRLTTIHATYSLKEHNIRMKW